MHKLLTDSAEALTDKLKNYPLYSQDNKGSRAEVVARLLLPRTLWEWYILEGSYNPEADTWALFGITYSDNTPQGEYGYIMLNELQEISVKIPVEDIQTGKHIGYVQQQVVWDTDAPAMKVGDIKQYRRTHAQTLHE